MSVTEAAKKLGIGRPALSNLLNGNAALSPEMAMRLETTFGATRQELLDRQASQDKAQRRNDERAVPVSAYVPSFLIIKARQIEEWAANHLHARDHLPVLLRKLIHSTAANCSKQISPAMTMPSARVGTAGRKRMRQRHGFPPALQGGSLAPTSGPSERRTRTMSHASRLYPRPSVRRRLLSL